MEPIRLPPLSQERKKSAQSRKLKTNGLSHQSVAVSGSFKDIARRAMTSPRGPSALNQGGGLAKIARALEQRLERELSVQKCSGKPPSMQSLSVYRDTLALLGRELQCLQPFLSTIQQHYDAIISSLQEDVASLEELKPQLAMSEQLHSQELAGIYEKYEIERAKAGASLKRLAVELEEREEEAKGLRVQVAVLTRDLKDTHRKRLEAEATCRMSADTSTILSSGSHPDMNEEKGLKAVVKQQARELGRFASPDAQFNETYQQNTLVIGCTSADVFTQLIPAC